MKKSTTNPTTANSQNSNQTFDFYPNTPQSDRSGILNASAIPYDAFSDVNYAARSISNSFSAALKDFENDRDALTLGLKLAKLNNSLQKLANDCNNAFGSFSYFRHTFVAKH